MQRLKEEVQRRVESIPVEEGRLFGGVVAGFGSVEGKAVVFDYRDDGYGCFQIGDTRVVMVVDGRI